VNEQNRMANSRVEIEASEEAWLAAKALLEGGFLRSAVSRLYYAMLHLVRALVVSRGFDSRTHEGVETLFALHFVREGRVDMRYSKLFAHLQTFREQADYGPVFALSRDDVAKDLAAVEEFSREVKRVLEIAEPAG